MQCVANFEVGSDVSVVSDDRILTINDPRGSFRVCIKNMQRSDYTTPFLLSFHIYFEAPDLRGAQRIAEDLLVRCMDLLAFSTGAGVRMHRLRQIVDAGPDLRSPMREVLMWGDVAEHKDPQPFLSDESSNTIERLLEFDVPPAIQRALRWYRLGVDASSPDDQFTYFWFALEIVAEFQKPTTKVHDKCVHCRAPLYCEQCEKHPLHKPFAKQAIHELMKAVDSTCEDETVALLGNTRNSLMHGKTLREIEDELPEPHDTVVDILGRILWKALVHQFPRKIFETKLTVGTPSTYVHLEVNPIVGIETVVDVDSEGNFDFDSIRTSVTYGTSEPPQSADPIEIKMSPDQYDRLKRFSHAEGVYQEPLQRVCKRVGELNGNVYCLVLATDMLLLKQATEKNQDGTWQNLFRKILEQNAVGLAGNGGTES